MNLLKNIIAAGMLTVLYMKVAVATSVWGEAGPNSLYLGMWSYHINPNSEHRENASNELILGVYKGFFLGTLIDSFSDRDYVAGVQRYWLQKPFYSQFEYYLGYRAGLIYGYGDKIIKMGNLTPPVLPFAQLITSVTWKHFGWELSYTGIVISTELYVKF